MHFVIDTMVLIFPEMVEDAISFSEVFTSMNTLWRVVY